MSNTNKSDALAYKGHVKVTTMFGKKVIKTQEFHNTGTPNLFNFFANCLWSTSTSTASAYRPSKIVLFKQHTDISNTETAYDEDLEAYAYSSVYWTEADAVSIPMFYDKTPAGDSELGPTDVTETWIDSQGVSHTRIIGKSIKLHFRIPYIYLEGNTSIVKMGLFPSTVSFPATRSTIDTTTDFGNMLAYYVLTKEDDKKNIVFDPIEVPEAGDNYTLIVDWTLSIANA